MVDAPHPVGPAAAGGGGGGEPGERWYLDDERAFLIRSIADAQAEHDAGDMSDEDFSVLVTRDQRRLAEVEVELDHLAVLERQAPAAAPADGPEVAGVVRPRYSKWRLAGIVGSSALIVLGVVILAVHALEPRLPGQSTSGGITQTKAQEISQQLTDAVAEDRAGHVLQSLQTYERVLSEDPHDDEALAESGWLEWQTGASAGDLSQEALGKKNEVLAIDTSPSYYEGHLFLGLIDLNQYDNAKAAVVQFDECLADKPPVAEMNAVASKLRVAYVAAGEKVPPALAGSGG